MCKWATHHKIFAKADLCFLFSTVCRYGSVPKACLKFQYVCSLFQPSYLVFEPSDPYPANEQMESVINDTGKWLITNFLSKNDNKTEMSLHFSMHRPPPLFPHLRVGGDFIIPSEVVRNLGVLFDSSMSMDKQISSVVKSSFASLHDMYKARCCLTTEPSKTMVHSFISSRLDYCNSLLFGLPNKQIKKLQGIQNMAARLITNTYKYDHITPILIKLHWLPIQKLIIYKILLLTFKCLH